MSTQTKYLSISTYDEFTKRKVICGAITSFDCEALFNELDKDVDEEVEIRTPMGEDYELSYTHQTYKLGFHLDEFIAYAENVAQRNECADTSLNFIVANAGIAVLLINVLGILLPQNNARQKEHDAITGVILLSSFSFIFVYFIAFLAFVPPERFIRDNGKFVLMLKLLKNDNRITQKIYNAFTTKTSVRNAVLPLSYDRLLKEFKETWQETKEIRTPKENGSGFLVKCVTTTTPYGSFLNGFLLIAESKLKKLRKEKAESDELYQQIMVSIITCCIMTLAMGFLVKASHQSENGSDPVMSATLIATPLLPIAALIKIYWNITNTEEIDFLHSFVRMLKVIKL